MPENLQPAPAALETHEQFKVSEALGWYATAIVGRFRDSARFEEACADRRARLVTLGREMIGLRTGPERTQFVYTLESFMRSQWEKDDIPEKCRTFGIDPTNKKYAAGIDNAYQRIFGLMIATLSAEVQELPAALEAQEQARHEMAQVCEGGGGI